MFKILIQCSLFFLFIVVKLQAQAFEGSFIMQIMDEGSISRMMFMVKKDKILIEPIDEALARPVRILMQKGDDHLYLLTEEQGAKVAIMNVFTPPAAEADSVRAKQHFTLTETGKKKMIGVYECREVIVDNGDGQKLDMWVTPTMGFTLSQLFDYIGRFTATLNKGDYTEITKNNKQELFQKNMALEINELKEGSSTQITIKDITKKILPDTDFDLQGYTIIDMNKMMGK